MPNHWRPIIEIAYEGRAAHADMRMDNESGQWVHKDEYYALSARLQDMQRDLNAALDRLSPPQEPAK